MKTAISIPDKIFKKAEKTAKKMGLTRSNLYTIAITEFLENHAPSLVKEKLDEIYSTESSKIDADLLSSQIQSIDKDEW